MFNFIEEDSNEETLDDDEGFLDLSDLYEESKEENEEQASKSKGMETLQEPHKDALKVAGLAFDFEDEVPTAKKITDKEVQTKAKRSRKRSVSNMDYAGKVAAGWSYCCAHKEHLPNLCERYMDEGKFTCTCTCHTARGYVVPKPESLLRSDDEERILLFS